MIGANIAHNSEVDEGRDGGLDPESSVSATDKSVSVAGVSAMFDASCE